MDATVLRAGVRDAEAVQVEGFPHLRTSRFLASFAGRDLSDQAFDAWVGRMAALDLEARELELANLPETDRTRLDMRIRALNPAWTDSASALEMCFGRLTREAKDRVANEAVFGEVVVVPDDYSLFARTLGLYPLSAIPVALGYQQWQAHNLPAFARPLDRPVDDGTALLFEPARGRERLTAAEVREDLAAAAEADPLAIPKIRGDRLQALAATFAPSLLITVESDDDRIGHPVWRRDGLPAVDPARPVAFVRLTHTWFEDAPIAQLVYLFWFDARPPGGLIDLAAGRLDGLIWRVSLGSDGRPIVYDTIHACGCYHLFFPAPGTSARRVPENRPSDPRDPILIPANAAVAAPEERMVVRVAAGSHYVTGVGAYDALGQLEPTRVPYEIVSESPSDRSLRSMPLPGGSRRSLYGPDGLVDGTERGERVLLWPMGIAEPGAMRQWGRHASAFVGKRHFDDPDLIERAFVR